MKRSTLALALVVGGGLAAAILGFRRTLDRGFSARDNPTVVEAALARRLRNLSVPRRHAKAKNPVPSTPAVLAEARAHFADHCALCHGNDGGGRTWIGQHLYPKAPDMRLPATQNLPDGHLFYLIKNGVRLTGMPAWGEDTPEDDRETWKLVHFIRHLPNLTPEELSEMETMNPKSRREWEEEDAVRRFLEGGTAPDSSGGEDPHRH